MNSNSAWLKAGCNFRRLSAPAKRQRRAVARPLDAPLPIWQDELEDWMVGFGED